MFVKPLGPKRLIIKLYLFLKSAIFDILNSVFLFLGVYFLKARKAWNFLYEGCATHFTITLVSANFDDSGLFKGGC